MDGEMEDDMAWAEFHQDFDHLTPGATIAYKAGMRCGVTRVCLSLARALGRASEMETPDRQTAEALKADPHWRG